jgi:hypothetical protein
MAMNEDILLKLHQLSDNYFHLVQKNKCLYTNEHQFIGICN